MILECFRNRKQRETRGESLTRHYVPASRATILDRARVKGGWSELQEGGLSRSSPPFIFSYPAVACSSSAMARKVAAAIDGLSSV
jgi:hypothetical protein